MRQNNNLFTVITLTVIFITSCKKEMPVQTNAGNPKITAAITNAVLSSLTEAFESGTKTSYTAASTTLSSGSWHFDDALIGNSSTDRKIGSQAGRFATLVLNYSSGASTVSIKHGLYGSDGLSTWELHVSMDGE